MTVKRSITKNADEPSVAQAPETSMSRLRTDRNHVHSAPLTLLMEQSIHAGIGMRQRHHRDRKPHPLQRDSADFPIAHMPGRNDHSTLRPLSLLEIVGPFHRDRKIVLTVDRKKFHEIPAEISKHFPGRLTLLLRRSRSNRPKVALNHQSVLWSPAPPLIRYTIDESKRRRGRHSETGGLREAIRHIVRMPTHRTLLRGFATL